MRVLIIEDEPRIVEFIKEGLEQEGHEVYSESDGRAGLAAALSENHDAIILDVMLPLMDGFAVCRELRDRDVSTPIIMLTARDDISDRVEGLNTGADDYLTKPFAFEELLARIGAVTRRNKAGEANAIKIADLEIDLDRHVVSRRGQVIELTPKEFNLLEYLVLNKNIALSRMRILESVWGFDFAAETNVVDVYIRYLRQKLDEGFEPKIIKTVRGVGYMAGE
ncbi:MAG: response regulator transcription factor [Actinomycetota bacterium]|nr:response regulator transcription factor [Actinomycetota bacterium]